MTDVAHMILLADTLTCVVKNNSTHRIDSAYIIFLELTIYFSGPLVFV